MIPFFAYAAYLDERKVTALTSDAPLLALATFLDWQVSFNDKGLATLTPSPGSSVDGAIYRFRDRNWQEMDEAMENIGPYQHLPVQVIYCGEKIQAETYYLNGQEDKE